MKQQRLSKVFLSIWMVLALLSPNVAQAAMTLQPSPALPETFQAGGSAELSASAPLGLQPETAAGSTTSAPVEASAGRLLFAPAIDADGDPASNPVISTPVPVIDLAGEIGGVVILAAQLAPDDAAVTPIGVPVTFRVWDARGDVQFEQTARSDAWGAVSVQVILRDVDVEYSYQASAPGYGETEVRYFRFDPAQAAYRLHLDGAQLWYWKQGPGQVLFTLRSPVPLDAERDAVTLQIVRRPADAAAWDAESPLQPLIAAIEEAGLGLPFPEVPMQVVGTYTATVEVQLPPGDYGFIGSVAVNTAQAEHFFSQPLQLVLTQGAQHQTAAAIWASPLEHEPGRVLVQYRAPSGQASFDLVDTDQLPEISDDWEGKNLFVKAWRTGPFTWQEERYEVTVETVVDDGKKVVTLADFDYDPLLRRYTLAIESLQAQPVTDTLVVDVFGPGGVVIKHEEAQVVLEAGRVLHYSVEVPAELGQPESLRVELKDPLIDYVHALVAAAKTVVSAVGRHGSATFQVTAYGKVLGIELLRCTISTSGGGCKWGTDLDALKTALWDILKEMESGKLALGTAGVRASLSFTAHFTVDPGECPSPEGLAKVRARLQALARDLNKMAAKLPWGDTVELPSVPVWWILEAWISGSGGVRATVTASGLTLMVGGAAYVDIAGNIGINLTGWWSGAGKAWWIIQAHHALADIILAAAAVEGLRVPQDNCDPEPPDPRPPDDRQDVWQGIEGFYEGQTDAETIDNLNSLLERAQAQHLERAERLLTLRLRETELARFSSDMDALDSYLDEVDDIAQAANVDLQGLISGTLPISPSATLTEALVARIEQAVSDLESLPYARDQQSLLDAVAVAERQYQELRGQELELQQELRQLLTADAIGVLTSGFADATLAVLEAAGLPSQLVSPWPSGGEFRGQPAPYFPPDLAPRALVLPSGGLHAIAGSPEARAWLDEYVAGGGLLIVFTQAYGADWAALPGGEVTGVGYEEDQRCQHDSVRAVGGSNWLVWMGRETPDIQVDGAFTAWPENTRVLLTRTRGRYAGYPAMIEYAYGAGQVLATSAYGDWAWKTCFWWGDDWQMTRSVLIRAYLLTHGQDVNVAFAADPAGTVEVAFPITNTSALTTTAIEVILPARVVCWGRDYADTVPLSIAPGESGLVTAALFTPPLYRGVHNWTQGGLWRLKVTVNVAGGGRYSTWYSTWGPFVYVRSPVMSPKLTLSLHTRTWASLFETVPVTATVENHTDVTRTVVLRGQQDLPTAPVTLTVPPLGRAEHIYNLRIGSSKHLSAVLYDESNRVIDRARAAINVAYPQLRARPIIPPAIANGAALSLVVTNQPRPRQPHMHIGSALVGSVALTLTAPSGAAVWTATQALPPLAVGEVVTPTFTLNGLEKILEEYGTYRLWYRVDDGRLSQTTSVPLPARADVRVEFDRSAYRIREPLTLTVQTRNTGRFDLAPGLALVAPELGLSDTLTLTLPAGAAQTLTYTFTVPEALPTGDYSVQAVLSQGGDVVTHTAVWVIPPADIVAGLEPGPYRAGKPLTVTLTNHGGVDAVVTYTLALRGYGVELSLGQDLSGTLVPAGTTVVVNGVIPQAVLSGRYTLCVNGVYTPGNRPVALSRLMQVSGIGATISAHTDRPTYLTGEEIRVGGGVTATAGAISGTLELQINSAEIETNERVNDDAGTADKRDPFIAVDAEGNAYAVWEDNRNGYYDYDIYFAYRPAGGTWGANIKVNDDTGTAYHYSPSIAVDADGNAYAVWRDNRNGQPDIYFAYRPAGGTWGPNIKVNDDPGGENWQTDPSIAVDADGNAYVVWEDYRNANYIDKFTDIYFAYRPAGGTWGPNIKVNDDTGTADQWSPSIAVDADGNAYAVWEDERNDYGDIYLATRPAGGTWSANIKVNDDTGTAGQWGPSIAVDADGNAYAVWVDYRNGNNYSDIYFATRPPGGAANGNAYAVWVDNRNGNDDIYFALVLDSPVQTLWQRDVAVHTATTQAISETVGTLQPGKYWLAADLRSEISQTLATSRYPFYIFPADTALTLETDQEFYRPGQTIQVSGRVTNTAVLTATLPLTVTAGEETLLADTFTLAPGEGAAYSTTLTATADVILVATAGAAEVIEQVLVSAPQVEATLEAPELVGHAPFSVSLAVTNTGVVSVALAADFAGQMTRTATLESGAASLLQATLAITEDTPLVVTLSGDVALTLTQAITQGEIVTLALGGDEAKVRAGSVTLPFTLTGAGPLPVAVELSATVHSAALYTYTRSLVILPGQVYAGELPLELPPGAHQVRVALYDALGHELASQEITLWAVEADAPEQPEATISGLELSPQPVGAGEVLTGTLTLRNEGMAGPVIVGWQAFDLLQQTVVTLTDALTQTYVFTLSVPADIPAGSYVGEVSVDGQGQSFTLDVTGVDVALGIALDRPWYLPGDVIHLTTTLTESAGLSGDYNLSLRYLGAEDYVTVTVPSGQVVQHTFTFTATEAGRASVTLAYTPSENGHRIIMIDSLPVEVVDPSHGVYLTHDRLVYNAGDTIYLTATITGTLGNVIVMGPMELALQDAGFLMWQAPAEEEGLGLVLSGDYPLSYTLPAELRTGRYTFLVQADGQRYTYAVDVRGWTVTSRRVTLDKPRYAPEDELAATVEFFNEGKVPIEGLRLSAWIAPPNGERGLLLTPPVSRTVDLQPGLNVFTVTGAFSTTFVGPHRLVVNVEPGCCCGWRVAGAAAQFDVGWAHLVELTTDHGNYTPGEPGLGQLDVYGYGPTHLVVTATNGSTLLDQTPDLAGYGTFTFTIPTTLTGDYLLVAHSSDQNGNSDDLIRAYAVSGPRDTQPPTLMLTYPNTDTVITTAAPTTTITVQGNASDDSGQVTVLVNGEVVTPTAGGDFSLLLEVHQGFNMVSVTALDAAGNNTYWPIVPVYLLPARAVTLSADRTEAAAGERVTFQAVLTSSGALSAVLLQQSLPSTVVTDVVASASSGEVSIGGLSPAWHVVEWQGNLDDTQPVTVTVTGTLMTAGLLTQTVTVYWGWGFSEVSDAVTINIVEVPVLELGGYVWHDVDKDGIQDAGEEGVPDIDAALYDNGDCTGNIIQTDTTDNDGFYLFTDLLPGTYCIQFSNIPAGWSITLQDQDMDDAVDSDADQTTAQIQNIVLTASDLTRDMGLQRPTPIGGITRPDDPLRLLAPWIELAMLMALAVAVMLLRRRMT